jgi:hypothetical protein
VINEIQYNVHALEKILLNASEEFAGSYDTKKRSEIEVRRRLAEVRARVIQQVERCF